MEETTTQQGVAGPMARREAMMKAMADKRHGEFVGEEEEPEQQTEEEEDAEVEEEEGPADQLEQEEDEEPESEPAPEPEPPVYLKDGKWYARRKVDGKEEEVPFDEMLSANQKTAAADARLREAAAKRQELELIERRLAEQERERIEKAREEEARHRQQSLSDLAREYHEKLLNTEPDDEEGQAELAQLLAKMQAQPDPINPQSIIDQAVQRATMATRAASWDRDLKQANKWAAENHKDLWNDEILHGIAKNHAKQILGEKIAQGRKDNPGFSQLDVDPQGVYEEAVKRTEDWLSSRSGSATSEAETRVNRKREVSGKTATGTSAKAKLEDNEYKPKTQSEKIAELRRARGLPG